jgi:hypothetical protein
LCGGRGGFNTATRKSEFERKEEQEIMNREHIITNEEVEHNMGVADSDRRFYNCRSESAAPGTAPGSVLPRTPLGGQGGFLLRIRIRSTRHKKQNFNSFLYSQHNALQLRQRVEAKELCKQGIRASC